MLASCCAGMICGFFGVLACWWVLKGCGFGGAGILYLLGTLLYAFIVQLTFLRRYHTADAHMAQHALSVYKKQQLTHPPESHRPPKPRSRLFRMPQLYSTTSPCSILENSSVAICAVVLPPQYTYLMPIYPRPTEIGARVSKTCTPKTPVRDHPSALTSRAEVMNPMQLCGFLYSAPSRLVHDGQ